MAIRSLKSGIFSRSAMVGNTLIYPGSFESIATANGTGSSGIISFSSIPSTYTHLQIRGIANAGGVNADLNIRLNGDNTSIYTRHRLVGDGSSASSLGQTSRPWITFLGNAALSSNTNTYGVFVCDILDYTNTNKNTTVRVLSGQDSNGSGGVDFTSGLWPNTAAVTSISIQLNSGNFTTPTQFALYGVN
jgi:hypothetical protein